jgi:hypothetical protein
MLLDQRSSAPHECPFTLTLTIDYENSLFFHWHFHLGIIRNELSFFLFLPFQKSNIPFHWKRSLIVLSFSIGRVAVFGHWQSMATSKQSRQQAATRQHFLDFSCVSECATSKKALIYPAQHHPNQSQSSIR